MNSLMVGTVCFTVSLYSSSLGIEIIDFGFPQNSEIDTLKTYITTEGVRLSIGVRI